MNTTVLAEVARLARAMQEQSEPQDAVRLLLDAAAALPGCDMAGISSSYPGRGIATLASTDDLVRAADELQVVLMRGPQIQGELGRSPLRAADLARTDRWGTWGPQMAGELGLRAMFCVRLYARGRSVVSLALYGRSAGAFSAMSTDELEVLAGMATMATVGWQETDHLAQALARRTVIGQAVGVIMATNRVDSTTAFTILTRMSSQSNTKVVDLAQQISDHHDAGAGEGLRTPVASWRPTRDSR